MASGVTGAPLEVITGLGDDVPLEGEEERTGVFTDDVVEVVAGGAGKVLTGDCWKALVGDRLLVSDDDCGVAMRDDEKKSSKLTLDPPAPEKEVKGLWFWDDEDL